jgi:hypothetical protein
MAAWHEKIPLGRGKHVLSIVSEGTAQGYLLSERIVRFRNGDLSTTDANRLKMERKVVVCLAGMVAQQRFKPSSVRSWHGSSDFQAAVCQISSFTASDREREAYLKLLRIRTEQTLARPGAWECVEALAAALLDRKTLSATEVTKIIQAAFARKRVPLLSSKKTPRLAKK